MWQQVSYSCDALSLQADSYAGRSRSTSIEDSQDSVVGAVDCEWWRRATPWKRRGSYLLSMPRLRRCRHAPAKYVRNRFEQSGFVTDLYEPRCTIRDPCAGGRLVMNALCTRSLMCREFSASAQTVAVSRENDILYWGWTASQQSPPRPHCELRTSSSADFIFVGELSREVIGKGSHFERGPTAARVNSVQLDPIKLIFGKDPDEFPGLGPGTSIERRALFRAPLWRRRRRRRPRRPLFALRRRRTLPAPSA
jgi:hypothetical protein